MLKSSLEKAIKPQKNKEGKSQVYSIIQQLIIFFENTKRLMAIKTLKTM